MTDKEIKKDTEDSASAAGKVSQVSSKKKSKLSKDSMKWIVGGFIALVVLSMLFSGGGKKKDASTNKVLENKQEAQSQLQINEAKLRAGLKQAVAVRSDFSLPDNQPIRSKEYLARQNAPTSMYSDGSVTQKNAASAGTNAVQETTLADKSLNAHFANNEAGTTSTSAYKIPHPGFTVASGEFIHAELETAINSDLPGMVRAVITRPVYAYTGEAPLIPSGSRLIGQYSSAIVQGQSRVMIVWNRIILPSGIAVNVNSPGTDELGRAGQGADSVNRHFFMRFGEASLLSLIGAGMATYGVGSGDQMNSASQYRMAIAMSFQQSAQKALQSTLPIKPTIHIYQGGNINVFVAHDLSFYNVLKAQNG